MSERVGFCENLNEKSFFFFLKINKSNFSNEYRNSGGSGGEEESLSRSASDSSVSNPINNHNNKQSAPGTPLPSHGYVFFVCFYYYYYCLTIANFTTTHS